MHRTPGLPLPPTPCLQGAVEEAARTASALASEAGEAVKVGVWSASLGAKHGTVDLGSGGLPSCSPGTAALIPAHLPRSHASTLQEEQVGDKGNKEDQSTYSGRLHQCGWGGPPSHPPSLTLPNMPVLPFRPCARKPTCNLNHALLSPLTYICTRPACT